jgi:TRAP-type C4-dicarboxylate transport system permease small subunit
MSWSKWIAEKAQLVQEIISYTFLALAAALACLEVFSRYFFQSSHAWVEEMVKLLIISAAFICAGLTLMKGGHLGMDFLLLRMKGKSKVTLHLIINILTFLISVLFFYGGVSVFKSYLERGVTSPTEIALPMAVNFLPISIGFALLLVYCAAAIVRNITELGRNE